MKDNYMIAFYLRISDDDEKINAEVESESITAQRLLLTEYVNCNRELCGSKITEFLDDGYSGTNFDRPGVKSMLDRVLKKEIHCIIVKDFSRFGRNYLETGNYIEQIFPFLGVRFISVNDNYDSIHGNMSIDTAFKNIMHDVYSKDLSKKITSARKTRAEQGKFVTAFAPYGYIKSSVDKSKLIIDTECACIVKRIFDLYLGGTNKTEIARILNKEGIPTPMTVRKNRKENFYRFHHNEKCHWVVSTVSSILDDERYTGKAVYRKVAPESVGSKKDRKIPEKEWIIVPDTHEAIIDNDSFNRVKQMKKKHNYKKNPTSAPLYGKIICPFCHHKFLRKTYQNNSAYFKCVTGAYTNEYDCYKFGIKEKDLEEAVLSYLKKMVSLIEQKEYLDINQAEIQRESIQNQLKENEKAIERKKMDTLMLYEEFKAGKILKDIFKMKIQQKDSEILVFEKNYNQLQQDYKKIEQIDENDITRINQNSSFNILTKEMADEFIKTIYIYDNKTIKIEWKFKFQIEENFS